MIQQSANFADEAKYRVLIGIGILVCIVYNKAIWHYLSYQVQSNTTARLIFSDPDVIAPIRDLTTIRKHVKVSQY